MIETQESAYPYHDWNERINAECYEPNAVTRILDQEGRITRIENNYQKISFNFGPTLLNWIEEYSPQVYEALLEADKLSMARFNGHGNAIAQVYNHMIMPLANRHDKITQVVWGICDFKKRFKRLPEGMWLPETAVDLDTLRILIEHGIKYTILAPRQAKRVSPVGQNRWQDVSNGSIDTTMSYLVRIPSGGEISIFFYDGGISHNIAFGDLLTRGENLANTILAAAGEKKDVPHLIHVATDGETFGHHHKFGEMALAYCLNHIDEKKLARLTNYGEYLEKYPPTHEVEIFENSSWSCVHGIERWRDNCGCNSGGNPGWTQAWRRPLRKAMDWLRDALIPVYDNEASKYFISPGNARNDFIEVILDRSLKNIEKFFNIHTERELTREEKVRALKLLEMQRNAMLMYTSCGWFFDEVSGVENVQIMQYASKAIQYASEVRGGLSLEPEYLNHLKEAPSNKFENAARVYEKYVKPAECDLLRVGAHYCISSIFENYAEETKICCYSTKSDAYEQLEAGKLTFAVGKTHIQSDITWDEITISFAVLHFGDQNISAGVREFISPDELSAMTKELKDAFAQGNIPEIVRLMDNRFDGNIYSLWHLFKDEQKKVLDQILQLTYEGVETAYRQIYENNFTIMNFYDSLLHKIPRPFLAAAEYIINTDLKRIFEEDTLDKAKLTRLIDDTNRWQIKIDTTTIAFSVNAWVNAVMESLVSEPEQPQLFEQIIDVMEVLAPLSLSLNLWKAQNNYLSINRDTFTTMKSKAEKGDTAARQWVDTFIRLGHYLQVKI
jgi:alpha-amylase/alpha-mannosidase (GH57 family)